MDDSSKSFDRALVFFGIMGALVALLAVIMVLTRDETAAGAGAGEGTAASTLSYELTEFAILGPQEVKPGPVTLQVHNSGSAAHNLVIDGGPRTADLNTDEMATLDAGVLSEGTYTIFCNIPGHREAGMETILTVSADASDVAAQEEMSAEEMNQVMIDSMLAFPAETEGKGNQPLEPVEIKADGTKVFELTAEVIQWEVEPGKFVDAWAYNGQVPGPWIRVDVGDMLEINVTNLTPLGTDIHWHGISTPNAMDGVSPYTQDPILTGETFTYAFEAERPAIGMYHAHLHSQVSVPNGMFGPIMIGDTPLPLGQTISGVEIPGDLEIAQEIPMVLNDAGVIGLSLNGKSFPATEPYVANEGDWLVYHYYNEGLLSHPMHQHQFPQLVFAKDGIPLDVPFWADTINVAPGERYSVLVHADRVGTWVWHCHILTHVESEDGMFGMVTALIVQE
ncbi:MAG TPA: multicopper oxidase domain-containing protein [Acidimicrobiia bacterium]|nr:multicopper oxidase domain-containing protein [Acidimicrobiia bacterium]